MMVLRVIAAQQRGWRGFFTFASVLCAVLFADLQNGATAQLAADEAAETKGPAVAERYVLPITHRLTRATRTSVGSIRRSACWRPTTRFATLARRSRSPAAPSSARRSPTDFAAESAANPSAWRKAVLRSRRSR